MMEFLQLLPMIKVFELHWYVKNSEIVYFLKLGKMTFRRVDTNI